VEDSSGSTVACWTIPSVLIIDRRENNRTPKTLQRKDPHVGTLGPIRNRASSSHRSLGASYISLLHPATCSPNEEIAVGEDTSGFETLPQHANGATVHPLYNEGPIANLISELSSLGAYCLPEDQAAIGAFYAANCVSPTADPVTEQPVPHISKVIPASGPTTGGIEISLQGTGFPFCCRFLFGDAAAATTWLSENGCWCILPPRHTPREVEVKIEGVPVMGTTQPFTYIDTCEKDL
jgi:hypothetical protein